MRESLPAALSEKSCKRALNDIENPSERLTDGDQFILGSTEEKCRQGAVAMARLARKAMAEGDFSLSTLGSMVNKDATAAHRVLDIENPSIALQVLAALLILDRGAVWLGGTARLTGRDVVERPALTDAEFRARVERKAKGSKSAAAWLDEALEEKP